MKLISNEYIIDGIIFKRVQPMAFQFECSLPSKDIPKEFVSRVMMDFLPTNHLRVNEHTYGWVEDKIRVTTDSGPWKDSSMDELYVDLIRSCDGV